MSVPPQVEVAEFVSRHAPNIPMSLSHYKNKWYLVSKYTYGHLGGRRFFYRLNETVPPAERTLRDAIDEAEKDAESPRNTLWSSTAAEYTPSGPVTAGSSIHIILDSDPAAAKLTGRMRSETLPSKDAQVACYEVEILIHNDELLRQCYYCLEFESEGPRYKSSGDDTFWCDDCEKRGWATSAATRVSQSLLNDNLLPTYDKFVTETVNPLIRSTPTTWAGNPYYTENIYKD